MAFPLHPEIPQEGVSWEDLFRGRGLDIPAMMARLARAAGEEGLPFNERTMTYNSRRAQELGKWAEEKGKGAEFHLAVFKAYFAQGQNIGGMDVLLGVCRDLGLDRAEAQKALEQGDYAQAVDDDWGRSARMGVRAVPSFAAAGRMMAGAQPYPALARFVESAGSAAPLIDRI